MCRILAICILALALHSIPVGAATCVPGMSPRVQVELFFGRNIGEMLGVGEDAWSKFLDEEVTPRFPDGLTVSAIEGQWKDQFSGRIVREPGKRLLLIVTMTDAVRTRLGEIISIYKTRHSQQSVLMTERDICVAF